MNRNKPSKNKTNSRVRREHDPIPWRYCLLTLLCGLILVSGFFLAARQHFSSIDFGIKNSQLKKQKDELIDAQRQLLLTKEIALSPAAIKKVAKEIGLTDVAGNIEAFYAEKTEPEKPKAEKISVSRTTASTSENSSDNDKQTEKKTNKEPKNDKKKIASTESKSKKGA